MADTIVFGLGISCGLLFALILWILWTSLAVPLREWLTERLFDRNKQRTQPAQGYGGPPSSEGRTLVMSDIHIDTWDYARPGGRPQAFLDFLDAIKSDRSVKRVYLNGDLMDLPPYAASHPNEPLVLQIAGDRVTLVNGRPPGCLQPEYEPVLAKLGSLADPKIGRTCVYIAGNHDIGVSGLRYGRPDLGSLSAQIAWYPSVLLRIDETQIYIEHGHLHDPFLWLYMRYEIFDMLRGMDLRRPKTYLSGFQRQGKVGQRAGTEYRAGSSSDIATRSLKEKIGFLELLVIYRYRHAARKTLKELRRLYDDSVKVLTFGHTHLPDRYQFPDGTLYCNSGDWAGNSPNQTYLTIEPDGRVFGPMQWTSQTRL